MNFVCFWCGTNLPHKRHRFTTAGNAVVWNVQLGGSADTLPIDGSDPQVISKGCGCRKRMLAATARLYFNRWNQVSPTTVLSCLVVQSLITRNFWTSAQENYQRAAVSSFASWKRKFCQLLDLCTTDRSISQFGWCGWCFRCFLPRVLLIAATLASEFVASEKPGAAHSIWIADIGKSRLN